MSVKSDEFHGDRKPLGGEELVDGSPYCTFKMSADVISAVGDAMSSTFESLGTFGLKRILRFGPNHHVGVSKNRGGPPKSSILIGFSITNHPFWGTPIFGNAHVFVDIL